MNVSSGVNVPTFLVGEDCALARSAGNRIPVVCRRAASESGIFIAEELAGIADSAPLTRGPEGDKESVVVSTVVSLSTFSARMPTFRSRRLMPLLCGWSRPVSPRVKEVLNEGGVEAVMVAARCRTLK